MSEVPLRFLSDEARAKIGASIKQAWSRPASRKRYLKGLRKQHRSTDYRQKLSEGAKRMWERRRAQARAAQQAETTSAAQG